MSLARTGLFVKRSVGGLFAVEDMAVSTGARIFVHYTDGTDAAGYGTGPDKPVKTIDYAIGLCTASDGDVIYVMPGHAESITAADGIDCDVAGVSIIGLGEGNLLPIISCSAAAGSITIAAANVTLKNLRLLATFETGVTTGMTVAAAGDGLTLDGVQFRDTDATHEFLIHVSVATTVTDLLIKNCSFVTAVGTLSSSIPFAGSSSNVVICDNYFFVDSSDSVINHEPGAAVNIRIMRNMIVNADTDTAGYCIELKSTCTGAIHDNYLAYNKNDAEIGVGAAAFWFQNYGCNTIAQSGLLDPTTAHAIP